MGDLRISHESERTGIRMPETEKELLPEPIEVTDQELFDSAVADKPPGDEAKPDGKEPEVTQDDRPRD